MGAKQKEGVEAAQKEALRQGGVRILAMEAEEENPMVAIEGIRFLQGGGRDLLVDRSTQFPIGNVFIQHRLPERTK